MNASVPCFRTDLIKTLTLMQPRTTSRENLNRPDGTVVNEPGQSAGSRNASPRILGAARAIAAREGAGKVTIEAVAKEAGLSKGGVLYNFPTKKALLSSLLDQMLAAHRELLANVPVRHPARTLTGHLETVIHSRDVDDDLSMAILAAAASEATAVILPATATAVPGRRCADGTWVTDCGAGEGTGVPTPAEGTEGGRDGSGRRRGRGLARVRRQS